MARNYLIVALRVLTRQKLYCAINLAGLAVAIACALLIAEFVLNEWTYDRFHAKANRIYRVVGELATDSGHDTISQQHPDLGPGLAERVPGLAAAVRVMPTTRDVRLGAGEPLSQLRVIFVDPAFATTFDFPAVEGDLARTLADPSSAAVTRSTAHRLAGAAPILGTQLVVADDDDETTVTVTAVLADPPSNSSQQFDLVLPAALVEGRAWGTMRGLLVLLEPGVSPEAVQPGLERVARAQLGPGWAQARFHLEPLPDLHFDRRGAPTDFSPKGHRAHSYVLAGLAALILLIAAVNAANLALAQAALRSRELGVRRAVGAQRGQVRLQLLSEAFLLTAVAIGVGMSLAQLALPVFNDMVRRDLTIDLGRPATWAIAAGLLALVGVAAGWYPAAVLSRVQTTRALRGEGPLGGGRVRAGLVGLQFALAVFLAATTLAMRGQLEFVTTTDLGWEADHVVVFYIEPRDRQADLFEILKAQPDVVAVSTVMRWPGLAWGPPVTVERPDGQLQAYRFDATAGIEATLGLRLRSGRALTAQDEGTGVVVNTALAARLGVDDPVGTTLGRLEDGSEPTVVGVVEDFHVGPLYSAVEPAFLRLQPVRGGGILVRFRPGQVGRGTAAVDSLWAVFAPEARFRAHPRRLGYLFDTYYEAEQRWTRLVQWTAVFALGIAGLGLFGLAGFVVSRRTREIGVRKVLGATTWQILWLLYGKLGRLAAVACVVGWMAAWHVVQRWLAMFAYRAEPGVAVFGGAAALALAVVAASVTWQALRAAWTNPAEALRTE